MKIKIIASLAFAFVLAAITTHAQTTTYSIGASSCGPAKASAIDCYSMPLTAGGITTTAWIFADYPPFAADEFLTGLVGDYQTSNVTIVASGFTYDGKSYPTEIMATLTGVEGTTSVGMIDLKISYTIGKTGRYTTGPIAATAGGVMITQPTYQKAVSPNASPLSQSGGVRPENLPYGIPYCCMVMPCTSFVRCLASDSWWSTVYYDNGDITGWVNDIPE